MVEDTWQRRRRHRRHHRSITATVQEAAKPVGGTLARSSVVLRAKGKESTMTTASLRRTIVRCRKRVKKRDERERETEIVLARRVIRHAEGCRSRQREGGRDKRKG